MDTGPVCSKMEINFSLNESDYQDFWQFFYPRKLPLKNWVGIYLIILVLLVIFLPDRILAAGLSLPFWGIFYASIRWDDRRRDRLRLKNFQGESLGAYSKVRKLSIESDWLVHSGDDFSSKVRLNCIQISESDLQYFLHSHYNAWQLPKRTPESKKFIDELKLKLAGKE